jgi:hypothetical protein
MAAIGVLTLYLRLPGCASLKEKRSRLKPLLARLPREFNISAAEIDQQDLWHAAVIACALISADRGYAQRALETVRGWIEKNWPDIEIYDDRIELL